MTQPWLRLYRGTVNNPKLQRLGLEVVGFWTNCLCLSDDDGCLPSVSDIAWTMRLSETQVETFLETLQRNNLVDLEGDGVLRLHDWAEHQKVSDVSTDRVRKFREKQRQIELKSEVPVLETQRNVSETVQIRTDTEKKEKNMSGSKTPDGFEEFWKAYPRTPNMSKSAALKVWLKLRSKLPPQDQLLQAVAKYREFLASETKKNGKTYPAKHAQGWLNEERWTGFISEPIVGTQAPYRADWADEIPQWSAFKSKLPASEWQAWFATSHPNGAITTLVAPSQFAAEQVAARYGSKLEAHFGEAFQIKTKGDQK